MGCLHPDPYSRAIAKKFSKPNRNRRGDGLLPVENVIKRLSGYTEQTRDLGFALSGRGNHDLGKKFAGMGRFNRRMPSVSVAMVVLHVNICGVLAFKRKGDAPIPRNSNSKAPGLIPFERMEAQTWNVHFRWLVGSFPTGQYDTDLLAPISAYHATVTLGPVALESLA